MSSARRLQKVYSSLLKESMTQINKSHRYAMNLFVKACQKQIGIKPIEDNRFILNAYVDFSAYIKTYKKLDLSVKWHKHFIHTMVDVKLKTLSKRINQVYGSHKAYLDIVRESSKPKNYTKIKKSSARNLRSSLRSKASK